MNVSKALMGRSELLHFNQNTGRDIIIFTSMQFRLYCCRIKLETLCYSETMSLNPGLKFENVFLRNAP